MVALGRMLRTLAIDPQMDGNRLPVGLLTLDEFGNRDRIPMGGCVIQGELVVETPPKHGDAQDEQRYPEHWRSVSLNDFRRHPTRTRQQELS